MKVFDVPHACIESEFIKQKIPGYSVDWIRYGYFEFTKPECIQPNQNIIVVKKESFICNMYIPMLICIILQDEEVVIGPGICHLLNATRDGSTITQVPNLKKHPNWKHVFLQSTGGNRMLDPGQKYLFCKFYC